MMMVVMIPAIMVIVIAVRVLITMIVIMPPAEPLTGLTAG
jgi:hypothetical protein